MYEKIVKGRLSENLTAPLETDNTPKKLELSKWGWILKISSAPINCN